MDVNILSNTDIFAYTIQQPGQMENLANRVLSNGIDLYRKER